jgi:hypothetical protein
MDSIQLTLGAAVGADGGALAPASGTGPAADAGPADAGSAKDARGAMDTGATALDPGAGDSDTTAVDAGTGDSDTTALDAGTGDSDTTALDAGPDGTAMPAQGAGTDGGEMTATATDAGPSDAEVVLLDARGEDPSDLEAGAVGTAAGSQCVAQSSYPPCHSSCFGIDGIVPGASIVLAVQHDQLPDQYDLTCNSYQTVAVYGAKGVSVSATESYDNVLTTARGTFTSSDLSGCTGAWSLSLVPDVAPIPGDASVPVEASAGWHVDRTINFEQAQFCGSTFPARGALLCEDVFTVSAIVTGDQ